MEERRKVYVEVRARHLIDGTCRPETIKFENDEVYEIDRVKQCCRAASTKVGGTGLRYTVMICGTDVYSHIIDEDRRLNAQRFEETFYQKKNPSEVNGATVEPKKEPQGITEEAMLNYMVQNPDFLQKFKVLLGVGN